MPVNKVILIGRLGKDPETTYLDSGTARTIFSLATSEKWKKDDEWQDKTCWHNCVAWGKVAETIGQYLKKGQEVYLEGKIDNRKYEKDGVEKYISEVVVTSFQFVGTKADAE